MLILQNLLRRKVRTALSVVGISIGIAIIIAFVSIVRGHRESINNYARDSGAQFIVMSKGAADPSFSRISKSDIDKLRTIDGVAEMSSSFFYALRSPQFSPIPFLLFFGRNPEERLIKRYKERNLQGRLIEGDDEIMLGATAAKGFSKKVGDKLHVLERDFTVVGIYGTGIHWEDIGCVVSGRVIQKVLDMGDSANIAFIYLNDIKKMDIVEDAITKQFQNLSVVRAEEFTTAFGKQLEFVDRLTWIISFIAIIAGGIGVLNTMLMSISERVREIGTLRAVGWDRVMVFKLILSEGLVLSILGGICGILLGYFGTQAITKWYGQGFLTAKYSSELFIQAMLLSLVLGLAGALYPAYKASKLSPVEALKYE